MQLFDRNVLMHAAVLTLVLASPVLAQTLPPVTRTVSLDGPRFGVTFLNEGIVNRLREERGIEIGRSITQFGWQFEKQFFHRPGGVTLVTEWITLLGGLEQDVAIPSVSWMVGLRTRDGAEFGIGPNLTPAGTALVFAGGHTFRAGVVNVPVNVAVVPSKAGLRVTILSGFSRRSRR